MDKTITEIDVLSPPKQYVEKILQGIDTINAIGDGIILIDMDGKITSVNPAWEKMTGYESSEVIGKDAAEVAQRMHKPEDAKKLIAALRTAMKGKVPDSLVYTLIRKDGQEIPLTYTPSFIRDAEGKPTQIVGTVKDITEIKKAEEALRESEEKYRALFETAKDAIFVADETGKFIDVNQAACESLGYRKEELLKLSNREIDAGPQGYEAFLKIRDGLAKEVLFEVNQRRKDGTLIPVEGTGSCFTMSSKRIFLAIARDISERKRTEEEIRKLSSAVEQAIDGIAIYDLEPKLRYVNAAFARMHGYSPEEMIGMKVENLHNEVRMEGYKKGINQIMTQGSWIGETWHLKKDGALFHAYMSVTLLRGADGNPTGILAVARDITGQKRAEAEIRKEKRFSENIIATIPESLLVLDKDLRIKSANRTFYEIFQTEIEPEKVIGSSITDILQDTEGKISSELTKSFVTGDMLENFEIHYQSEKMGERIFNITARGIIVAEEEEEEEEEEELVVIEDITERKRAEEELKKKNEELKEAYRVKENFLKETSHRIITPVSIIGGNADVLLESRNLDDDQKARIRTIRERNEEIQKLVLDALAGNYLNAEEEEEGEG